MILSTVPGMLTLGCSGIRVVSRFISAIFADLAMRGFSISFLTLAVAASPGSFSSFSSVFPSYIEMESMRSNEIHIMSHSLFSAPPTPAEFPAVAGGEARRPPRP